MFWLVEKIERGGRVEVKSTFESARSRLFLLDFWLNKQQLHLSAPFEPPSGNRFFYKHKCLTKAKVFLDHSLSCSFIQKKYCWLINAYTCTRKVSNVICFRLQPIREKIGILLVMYSIRPCIRLWKILTTNNHSSSFLLPSFVLVVFNNSAANFGCQ